MLGQYCREMRERLREHCTRKLLVRTLHKKITCAVLTPECTDTFSKENNLYKVFLICLCQHCTKKLMCNVDPQPTNNFAQENNMQCCLDLCGPTLRKEFTSAMLAHG